jgi:AcrR family transcriptional regulator
MRRVQRREQILAAATKAFARNGFAATGLDDVAAEAAVTRVIVYRHFESKTDLYQAVLDRFCAILSANVAEPVGGFTDASIDGLLRAATLEPAGFRLLFQHAAREPEFKAMAEQFRRDITEAAHVQISAVVPDRAWATWAAELAPAAAIEAIIAWLDAGQPDFEMAAHRVRHVIAGVVTAAAATRPDLNGLPPTADAPATTPATADPSADATAPATADPTANRTVDRTVDRSVDRPVVTSGARSVEERSAARSVQKTSGARSVQKSSAEKSGARSAEKSGARSAEKSGARSVGRTGERTADASEPPTTPRRRRAS